MLVVGAEPFPAKMSSKSISIFPVVYGFLSLDGIMIRGSHVYIAATWITKMVVWHFVKDYASLHFKTTYLYEGIMAHFKLDIFAETGIFMRARWRNYYINTQIDRMSANFLKQTQGCYINNANCCLTMPVAVLVAHYPIFNIGMFKCCRTNSTTIEPIYNELNWHLCWCFYVLRTRPTMYSKSAFQ